MDPSSNGILSIQGDSTTPPKKSNFSYSLQTLSVHADDPLNVIPDVSPPIHVSTTFRYSDDPEQLVPVADIQDSTAEDAHIYSRETAPTTTRLETILTQLIHAPSLTYSSGLSAIHAAYVLLRPTRVSIGDGYHGTHGVIGIHKRLHNLQTLPLDCAAEDLHEGDVIHLETPLNPTGEAYNISAFAEKAHSRGAFLIVDATFGPPGLQDPFLHGADIVMHAGTKYFGGHSDLLGGILATKREDWMQTLRDDRTYLGNVMGSLEGWLTVRSIRTLELRVNAASRNAGELVAWLDRSLRGEGEDAKLVRAVVQRVQHASLQHADLGTSTVKGEGNGANGTEGGWLKKQMPNGFGPVFALTMKSEKAAKYLPSKLELFHHATSLGGVESLIEWRTMSDRTVNRSLLRVSIGVESWVDLRNDLRRGFESIKDLV
ncbi:hypothetical protein MMC25_007395 [Agyrium rufum]|nr:hypothetical protein [Agyrium rufum]